MADERLICSRPGGFTTGNTGSWSRVVKYIVVLTFLLLLLFPAVATARTINAFQDGKKQVPGSNPRGLSSNQFNVPRNVSGSSGQFNASKHEVPSGPNPISNR